MHAEKISLKNRLCAMPPGPFLLSHINSMFSPRLYTCKDIPTCHIPYGSQSAIPDSQFLHLSQNIFCIQDEHTISKPRLHSPEQVQARVVEEDIKYLHALQHLISVQDISCELGTCCHIVRIIKAGLSKGMSVKMPISQEVSVGGCCLLTTVHQRGVELLEMHREKDLPIADGIHAAAVQKLHVDFCPDAGQEKQCVHRLSYHGFDSSKNIHLTNSLGIIGMVDKKQSQQGIIVRVQCVHSKHIQEVCYKIQVLHCQGKHQLHPCGLCHVRHGNNFHLTQGPYQAHSLGQNMTVTLLGGSL
ncbi:hypothetical protein Nmel_000003 [Mimus melanotis]